MKSILLLLFFIIQLNFAKIYLTNKHFKHGTLFINKPGKYVLSENITFNPNKAINGDAYNSNWPTQHQLNSISEMSRIQLGFFAVISIICDDVEIDLNGFIIEQSEEHALLQRFIAIIEMANAPFLPNQGPHKFTTNFRPAKNIKIYNGLIGRSSHHGIRGNGNMNVQLKNIDFIDFEVAGIAIQGGIDILIENCNLLTNRRDVPVLGTFSSARFIQRYVDYLYDKKGEIDTSLRVQGKRLEIEDIKYALENSINNVYSDVILNKNVTGGYINKTLHPDEYKLYHNHKGVIDGNYYGILINSLGVAVNGFPKSSGKFQMQLSENININNVNISNLEGNVNEIITLTMEGKKKAMIDPVGAVFQLFNLDEDTDEPITITSLNYKKAKYIGNVVANAQAFVAKAILNGEFCNAHNLDIHRSSISKQAIEFIESGKTLSEFDFDYMCNADSMFHVNKGGISFKGDNMKNSYINNLNIINDFNIGKEGRKVCGNLNKYTSHPDATYPGYNGDDLYGITLSGSYDNIIQNVNIKHSLTLNGRYCGLAILTDSYNNQFENINIHSFYKSNEFVGILMDKDSKDNILVDCCIKNNFIDKKQHNFINSGTNNILLEKEIC